jgi:hypothetical protein
MSTTVNSTERDPLRKNYRLVSFQENRDGIEVWTFDDTHQIISGSLNLNVQELRDLSFDLLQTWQREIGVTSSKTPLQGSLSINRAESLRLRAKFAAAGNYVLRQILENISSPTNVYISQIFRDFVAENGVDNRALVFMSNFDFLIPWRLLYANPDDFDRMMTDDDEPDSVRSDGFLGLAGVVDQMVRISEPRTGQPGRNVPVGIHVDFRSRPGGEADIRSSLSPRPDLNLVFAQDERELTTQIAQDGSALIYLFCHGRFRLVAGTAVQELLLAPNNILSGSDIKRKIPKGGLRSDPIAFINACQGGTLRNQSSSDLPNAFRKAGAGATVGPLVDMPIRFGGPYGNMLLGMLASGSSLGEALLESSVAMEDEKFNLLGLTYASVNGLNSYIRH